MKKQIVLTITLALLGLTSFAQDKPGWIYNKPKPTNDTYLYDLEWGEGRTAKEAENDAISKVFRFTAMQVGQPFESGAIDKALQDGINYSVIARQYNIPINKVCEYVENTGNRYMVYVLFQVAKSANIATQWSDFRGCDRQGIDGMAVLKSALLPGLGQLHKGQTAKGVCFLAGEAALVGGAVMFQSRRHSALNKMNNTNDPTEKEYYARQVNNATMYRNISIGAAAAVYVWNVLDAIISKSHHTNASAFGNNVQLTPVIADEYAALSLSINF